VEDRISKTIDAVKACIGKDISLYDRSFLEVSIEKRLGRFAISDPDEYCELLKRNHEEAFQFYNSLNITFSEFFRNSLTFSMLEHYVLYRLLAKKREAGKSEIRIWSAGCASGQEAYSLAILLSGMGLGISSNPKVRIFATDASEEQIDMAKTAVFDSRAVRNVRLQHITKYFTRASDRYSVNPEIKQMVEFSVFDLLGRDSIFPSNSIYGGFDIVMCCNLLYYYGEEAQAIILDRLYRALNSEGCLVTDDVEKTFIERMRKLRPLEIQSPIFCRLSREE
jgi:chemotaxis protein methyltransferase CheR